MHLSLSVNGGMSPYWGMPTMTRVTAAAGREAAADRRWAAGESPLRESASLERVATDRMTQPGDQEREWLRRIAQGDTDALSSLYDRFSATLFSIGCRLLGNESEAEDLLQEVFLKIWDKAQKYDAQLGSPTAWLITLTRNAAHDRLRSSQRRHRLADALTTDAVVSAQVLEAAPDEGLLSRETVLAVRTALVQLPVDQRQAIEFAFVGGLTQSEIAAQLGEPLGTIKARIRRGMLALRDLLPPELQNDVAYRSDPDGNART